MRSANQLPNSGAESIQAFTYKPLHNDFEDNLVVASALSANVDFLVTNDEVLLRHAPIACLSSNDMLALLKEEGA